MRVTLATTVRERGGVWRHVLDLAGALRDRGIAVAFDVPRGVAPLADDVRRWEARAPRPARGGAEILHLHLHDTFDVSAVRAAVAARLGGRGVVVLTEHLPRTGASDPTAADDRRTPGAALAKTLLKRLGFAAAHATVVVNDGGAAFIARRYGVASGVSVVTLGLPELPSSTPIPSGPPVVLAVGALIRQKGHDVLIDALGRSAGGWSLAVAGGGSGEDRLRARAAERRLDVAFLGARRDVPELLASAHVACLPSRWEGFPYAGLEAMAAGRPLVASRVDGLAQQVADGRTGILVPPDDPAALAAALDGLCADPTALARLGAAGRRRVEDEFDFGRMVDGTIAVYRAATDRAAARVTGPRRPVGTT